MALPSIKRARDKVSRPADAEERIAFRAELPGETPEHPLWQLSIEVVEKAEGDGERLRVRAHIRTSLGEARALGRMAQGRLAGESSGTMLALARGLSRAVSRGLELPLVRRLAEPLLRHDLNTWVEIQISTAALDEGSRALLPAPEQLARLGIVPRSDDAAPIVESWAGQTASGGKPGAAHVSLLRLAKEQLPAPLASLLGSQPFQLAAAMVNVVEERP
jgi:hypothetical protein